MLNQLDKSKLKNFLRGDMYSVLQRLGCDMIEEYYKDLPSGDTEFLYLKNSLERDGKIIGIDRFLKRIEEIANQYDSSRG